MQTITALSFCFIFFILRKILEASTLTEGKEELEVEGQRDDGSVTEWWVRKYFQDKNLRIKFECPKYTQTK